VEGYRADLGRTRGLLLLYDGYVEICDWLGHVLVRECILGWH
jgi:hypothetical protein